MKLHRSVSVLGLFLILVAIDASAQGAARRPQFFHERLTSQRMSGQDGAVPVKALPIRDFKLLDSTTGWVSTGNRLLWTKDNGAHWKDISPPNPNQDEYASIVFHDRDAGWVLFSHPVQDSEQAESNGSFSDWKFYLSRTLDGGATWTTENLPQWRGERGLSNRGVIAFADKQHGWLSLGVEGNTMTAGSALLVTSDGGRTWHDTPDAKEGPEGRIEGILTISERDIWVLAAPEGGSALWATRDGGNSYQKISLSSPMEIAAAENPVYSLPVFSDSIHGYETVTYSGADGAKSAAVLFVSNDGGRTWKPDRTLSNLVEQETVKSTVAGSRWIIPFASYGSKPTILKLGSNDRIAAPAHQSSGDLSRCDLNFSTPAEGWMNCSGSLSSTIDGGATWTSIQPRARKGDRT